MAGYTRPGGASVVLVNVPDLPDAACGYMDRELWFSGDAASVRKAKAVCADCPARVACLDWAQSHRERFGVWGGLTADERREQRTAAIS